MILFPLIEKNSSFMIHILVEDENEHPNELKEYLNLWEVAVITIKKIDGF